MKVYLAAFLIAFSILGSYYGLIDPQSPARRLSYECRCDGAHGPCERHETHTGPNGR